MRHLGSLVLSLVLAPIIWVLTGYGMGEFGRVFVRFGGGFRAELLAGLAALVVAGILVAVLLLPRLSPVGPMLVGLGFVAASLWAAADLPSFADVANYEIFGQPGATLNPASSVGLVVGVPLLLTALSPRRWRRHERPAPVYPGAAPGYANPAAPYPGAGTPGYQPAHTAPAYPTSPGAAAFGAPPGSPAAPYQPPGSPAAPYQAPGAPAGWAPPGSAPQPGWTPPSPGAPAPPVSSAPPAPASPQPPWTPPVPAQPGPGPATPPPPPHFAPHVPRQTEPEAAADATDATTRLGPPPSPPSPPAQPGSAAAPPAPTSSPAHDEATTVLPDQDGAPSADTARDRSDGDVTTRPLHAAPPPPAAYPPPGHATPTSPPTDPDETRRL